MNHLSRYLIAAALHIVMRVECTHALVNFGSARTVISWTLRRTSLFLLSVTGRVSLNRVLAKTTETVIVVGHVADALLLLIRSLKRISSENSKDSWGKVITGHVNVVLTRPTCHQFFSYLSSRGTSHDYKHSDKY